MFTKPEQALAMVAGAQRLADGTGTDVVYWPHQASPLTSLVGGRASMLLGCVKDDKQDVVLSQRGGQIWVEDHSEWKSRALLAGKDAVRWRSFAERAWASWRQWSEAVDRAGGRIVAT